MNKLKELYVSVDTWYKKQDSNLVKSFMRINDYDHTSNFSGLLYWYDDIKKMSDKYRDYFLGDKEITFDVVKKDLSLKWLNEKSLISSIAVGDIDDFEDPYFEDNIDGSEPLIFAYLYYKLNWDKKKYNNELYNSLTYTENIQNMFKYTEYSFPTSEEIEKIMNKKLDSQQKQHQSNFIYEIRNIIDEFEDKNGFEDKIDILKQLII